MNKFLSKLKGDLKKANEVIQDSSEIVSHARAGDNRLVEGEVVKEKTKGKTEEQEMSTDM